MKTWMKIGYIILSFVYFIYLLLPNTTFPNKLDDALQSDEPADTETSLRRAYFTNHDRSEVLMYYQDKFKVASYIQSYRLNYPPEESQTLIRDQTMSTYLEEMVYPFRESLFINGFEPKTEKDTIIINNLHWEQKIIVRHVTSKVAIRTITGIFVVVLGWLIIKQWIDVLDNIVHMQLLTNMKRK
jgi:hypothetical protein